ncbi:hypothetical protein [Desulfuromonas acetoxidans]|uniref:hypothetical protein n=1 Tax=Desulfuromonas acetoxidans TaxID=891 RepID=UPI00292E03F5|nr:hypothetical protein [Desulfuromonas acetoxidans]
MKYLLALLVHLSLFSGSAFAESEIDEIRNLFEGVSKSTYCENSTFLKCLNISILSCNNAVKAFSSSCLSNQLIQALSGKLNDDEQVRPTIKNESNKYTSCLSEKLLEYLSIPENKFNSCGSHITEQLLLDKEKLRRVYERS